MYTLQLKKKICGNICPSKAFHEHITSDKHFGEHNSDLDNSTTHLSPHNLNPQHKQLEGNIINKHEQLTTKKKYYYI